MENCYKLAPGVQVRKEDFGLLFYKMKGPRLFFLPSKNLLEESFFQQKISLTDILFRGKNQIPEKGFAILHKALQHLTEKGVILEYSIG
jgi:putative mycofactocin binding protein MftB